jgi:hypothetical protein
MKNKKIPKKIIIVEKFFSSPSSAMSETNLIGRATKELKEEEIKNFNLKEFLKMGRILSKTEETKEELEKITDKKINFKKRVSYELVNGFTRYDVEIIY